MRGCLTRTRLSQLIQTHQQDKWVCKNVIKLVGLYLVAKICGFCWISNRIWINCIVQWSRIYTFCSAAVSINGQCLPSAATCSGVLFLLFLFSMFRPYLSRSRLMHLTDPSPSDLALTWRRPSPVSCSSAFQARCLWWMIVSRASALPSLAASRA